MNYVFALFIACVCLGFWVSERSWKGTLYVYVGEHRSPANIRSLGEYSGLSREALERAPQEQLLSFAQIYKDQGMLGVQLGHPIVNVKSGGKTFGCQVQDMTGAYDRIQMTFTGTGVTSGGEPGKMIVDSKCRSEQDLNQLETVWIPMQALLSAKPSDQEYEFPGESMTRLKFQSIPDVWPENWVLTNVRFYRDDDSEDQLVLDNTQMRESGLKLLQFDWKAD